MGTKGTGSNDGYVVDKAAPVTRSFYIEVTDSHSAAIVLVAAMDQLVVKVNESTMLNESIVTKAQLEKVMDLVLSTYGDDCE